MKTSFLALLMAFSAALCFSQEAGTLDPGFGDNGIVLDNYMNYRNFNYDVCIQDDGKIIAVGRIVSDDATVSYMSVSRHNTNGFIDGSFGDGGYFLFQVPGGVDLEVITSVALQSDGKIVFGGYIESGGTSMFILGRLTSDGAMDYTFAGGNGHWLSNQYMSEIRDIVIAPDGSILTCGLQKYNMNDYRGVVTKFTADGGSFSSFGSNGAVELPLTCGYSMLNSLDIMQDGSIVAGGSGDLLPSSYLLTKLNENGQYDMAFGLGAGVHWVEFDYIGAPLCVGVKIQEDGNILSCGYGYHTTYMDNDMLFARMDPNGNLDPSYSDDGIKKIDINDSEDVILSMEMQEDNKAIFAGYTNAEGSFDMLVFRLTETGTKDYSFGDATYAIQDLGGNDQIQAISLQADEKIVAVGFNDKTSSGEGLDFMLARYFSGLEVSVNEKEFQENKLHVFPNPVTSQVINLSSDSFSDNIDIILYNGIGLEVFRKMNVRVSIGENIQLQLPKNLGKGMYTLRINAKSMQLSEKIIIL